MELETKPQPTLQELLASNDPGTLLSLFQFTPEEGVERIVLKFNLWSRRLYPKYFKSTDADFHKDIDENNCKVFLGETDSFTDCAFRNAAKTTRTKLFFAFWIANDTTRSRRYLKILAEDGDNAKQSVTDIYNMLVAVAWLYPEIFAKTDSKREETMSRFTTSTGIKLTADTVGTSQRGDVQEDARPDIIWFDDFETRKTLRSATTTYAIWLNMQEAIDGLAKPGGFIATCNYISERGNVHKLVLKKGPRDIVLIVSIKKKDGSPTWPSRYTKAEVDEILRKAEEPAEYTQNPSASKDILFDRASVDKQVPAEVIKEVSFFKIYKAYNPSHRYAGGHDVAGGVGLDASTSCFIDFDTIPAQVVATYVNNEIKEDDFGDEIAKQGERYGECLLAPEKNNHGHATIGRLKQLYPHDKILKTPGTEVKADGQENIKKEYGWLTNGLTKTKMFKAFSKAVEDGLISLNDPMLIAECRSYTRNDLMDAEVDPRMTTRHFDLLIAACIAWQMKDLATVAKVKQDQSTLPEAEKPQYPSIGM